METKTKRAISLYQQGKIKTSMALFSRFKIGFTLEQRRAIDIAHECIENESRTSFYRSIGIDVDAMIGEAKHIIKTKYCV